MTIAAILATKGRTVHCIAAGSTIGEAARELAGHRIGAAPVVDGNGTILGIFSERDVVSALARAGERALARSVEEAMSAPAVTVTEDTPAIAALQLITMRRIRHLPVVEDGEIRGIVSIGDLVKWRIERIEAEASALRDYIRQ